MYIYFHYKKPSGYIMYTLDDSYLFTCKYFKCENGRIRSYTSKYFPTQFSPKF